ncbi:MAG: hypothetical protein GY697_09170 [Desulfobacterales bacterium]|nr:hypothetical protein [Desulfobacterales bacterium]
MTIYDLTEFLRLSSALNYNLSAASMNRYNILRFILGGKTLHNDRQKDKEHKAIVMDALNYLFAAYSHKRRRLGPMAVLHPLRASAVYAKTPRHINIVDILSTLFHDILEDIRPQDFESHEWEKLEGLLYDVMGKLDQDDEWRLMERLQALTRFESETYYQYIGRLLDRARNIPELVQIKLADRLDNTLDMRIDIQDPIEGIDFFEKLFQILFVENFKGFATDIDHPPNAALNGAKRLYQLFKNAVLLSMIRQKDTPRRDNNVQVFFKAVSSASLKEAQRTFIHILSYHHTDLKKARVLLLDSMAYCYEGRIDAITRVAENQTLDGLFSTYFGSVSSKVRNEKLALLYDNKPLMLEASVAFIVIFLSFLNDPDFYVKGISAEGITPG